MARINKGPVQQIVESKKRTRTTGVVGSPKYPYTITPGALESFLEQIPKRPKPPKVDLPQLKTWNIKDNNAYTIIKVLISLGVLNSDAIPTELFESLMQDGNGKKQLAQRIKQVYKEFFDADHEPYNNEETVKTVLNIHGGTQAPVTLSHMKNTFMVLCRAADFAGIPAQLPKQDLKPKGMGELTKSGELGSGEHNLVQNNPSVVINIQLTLPPGLDEAGYNAFFASMKKNLWPDK